jgi:type III secretory pathway component EscR
MNIEYVKFQTSRRKDKKLMALFYDENKKKMKTTHFGQKGYSDFLKHNDEERKQRYINRHKKNENWNDFTSPGCLSLYILWNKKTLNNSITDYCDKFNLKLM